MPIEPDVVAALERSDNYKVHAIPLATPRIVVFDVKTLNCVIQLLWSRSRPFRYFVIANPEIRWCRLLSECFFSERLEVPSLVQFAFEIGYAMPSDSIVNCLNAIFLLLPNIAPDRILDAVQRSIFGLFHNDIICDKCHPPSTTEREWINLRDQCVNLTTVMTVVEGRRRRACRDPTHTSYSFRQMDTRETKGFCINLDFDGNRLGPLSEIRKDGCIFLPTTVITKTARGHKLYWRNLSDPTYLFCGKQLENEDPIVGNICFIYYEKSLGAGNVSARSPATEAQPIQRIAAGTEGDDLNLDDLNLDDED